MLTLKRLLLTGWWFVFYLWVYWDLGLHAVILQLMWPINTHKLQPYFWKQTMLSLQYMQALPGPHWVVGMTQATCTWSKSLACPLLHSDTFIFSDSMARWARREAGCLTDNPLLWMVRGYMAASFLWGGLVWCVCLYLPVPGTTGTEGVWQSENCSPNSRNGLRCLMYV